jgi:large subunit ribosomal protein L15
MPLQRRVPKRGFTNIFKKEWSIVNVKDLNIFEDGTVVTVELLKQAGLIKKIGQAVKLLGDGEVEKQLTVQVHKASQQAEEKISAKGGKIEVI